MEKNYEKANIKNFSQYFMMILQWFYVNIYSNDKLHCMSAMVLLFLTLLLNIIKRNIF